MSNVRVEIQSETAVGSSPARVTVYENDKIVAVITADIELKMGGDCGYYNCVTLTRKELK